MWKSAVFLPEPAAVKGQKAEGAVFAGTEELPFRRGLVNVLKAGGDRSAVPIQQGLGAVFFEADKEGRAGVRVGEPEVMGVKPVNGPVGGVKYGAGARLPLEPPVAQIACGGIPFRRDREEEMAVFVQQVELPAFPGDGKMVFRLPAVSAYQVFDR